MTIKQKIGTDEILLQLAEESAELAQAALKLRRIRAGVNPSPLSQIEAKSNLIEEIADVMVCIRALELDFLEECRNGCFYDEKIKRWKERLGIDGEKEDDRTGSVSVGFTSEGNKE